MRGEAVLELTSDCVPPKATPSLIISCLCSLKSDSGPSKTVGFNSDKNVISATAFYMADFLGRHSLL